MSAPSRISKLAVNPVDETGNLKSEVVIRKKRTESYFNHFFFTFRR